MRHGGPLRDVAEVAAIHSPIRLRGTEQRVPELVGQGPAGQHLHVVWRSLVLGRHVEVLVLPGHALVHAQHLVDLLRVRVRVRVGLGFRLELGRLDEGV